MTREKPLWMLVIVLLTRSALNKGKSKGQGVRGKDRGAHGRWGMIEISYIPFSNSQKSGEAIS